MMSNLKYFKKSALPDASLCNCIIGFSSDNAYNANTLIDGFWISGAWLGNGSVRRNYNGGIVESSFATGSGNGYWGTPGELDSNFEAVLDTTSFPWKTSTSMSSGLGTLVGSVRNAVGTAKSVQVWVRDPGQGPHPSISNFRLTQSALVPQANILGFGPGAVINQADRTITWTVDNGTDVTKLAPAFTLSTGATCTVSGNPVVSGAQFDFTSPVHYGVVSTDTLITRDYSVTVKVLPHLALPVTAGVKVWLDASQLTGLTDGNPVAIWTDMSGWDNNATKSVGSPTYKTSVLNGKPVIRFVKTNNDAFTTADLSSQFPSAATVFIVTTINPGATAYSLFCSIAGNPADEWFRYVNGDSYPATFRSSRVGAYCVMPDSGSHIFAISSSSSSWQMWIDGTGQGAVGAAYSAGGVHVVGSGSNGGTLNGDIAEVIEFNRALNPTEIAAMNAYLTTKYFAASSPYDTWKAGFANFTDTDPTHDPLGDGLTNFQKFAFGLDPTSASSINPVTPLIGNQFTYTRYAASGLAYTVESSTDLAEWAPAITTELIGDANASGVQTVTVTVSDSPVNGKLFVRVHAE